MNLRDYLHHHHITMREMASSLGISYTYFRAVKCGKYKPSIELCRNIEILTGGQVTITELRG